MPAFNYRTPSWADPRQASVMDSPTTQAIRMLAQVLGADDPQAQVMGVGMATHPARRFTHGGRVDRLDVGPFVSPTVERVKELAAIAKQGGADPTLIWRELSNLGGRAIELFQQLVK